MATNPQNTTNITFGEMYSNNNWGLGNSSKAVRLKQFPGMVAAVPNSSDVWQEYLEGVLRGNTDGYSGEAMPINVTQDGADHAFSRTFTENSPPNTTAVAWAQGGDPACPYTPSLTSPAAGGDINAGFDYTQMPQGPDLKTLKADGAPVGDGAWGSGDTSLMSPDTSSQNQSTTGGSTSSPSYILGKWGT